MSKYIRYVGKQDARRITADQFSAEGFTSQVTTQWDRECNYTVLVPDDVAAFLVTEEEFEDISGLTAAESIRNWQMDRHVNWIHNSGHSWMYGWGGIQPTGAGDFSYGMAQLMYDYWRVPANRYAFIAVVGAKAYAQGAAAGGFAHLLQNLAFLRTVQQSYPRGGLYAVCTGLNDLLDLTKNSVTGQAEWAVTISNYLLRPLATGVWEDGDASVVYEAGGPFATVASTDRNSGTGTKQCTAPGAAVITVPTWFQGPAIHVGVGHMVGAAGCYVTIKLDGVVIKGPFYCGGMKMQEKTGIYRIPAAAGPHTVRVEYSNFDAGGKGWFDFWAMESKYTPVILFANIARPALPAAGGYNTMDKEHVDQYNAITSAAIEELIAGGVQTVGLVDIATDGVVFDWTKPYGVNGTRFDADNIHPNDMGHLAITEQFILKLQTMQGVSFLNTMGQKP